MLVEPQADQLENFSAQFERNGFDIRQAAAGDRGAVLGLAASSDLVLLGLATQGFDYSRLCRDLRDANAALPILAMVESGDEFESALMLELGADACIDRQSSPRLVAAQIRSLLRRRRVAAAVQNDSAPNDGVIRFGRLELLPFAYQVRVDGLHVHVPTRPFQALSILSGRPNEVVSREQLDPASTEGSPEKSSRAVDTRIARLRKILGAAGLSPDVIRSVNGSGYVFTPQLCV